MQPGRADASKCPAAGNQRSFRVGNDGHTVGRDAAGGLRAGILFMQMAILSWTKVDVDLARTIYLVTCSSEPVLEPERADPLLGASPPSLLSRLRVRSVDRLFFCPRQGAGTTRGKAIAPGQGGWGNQTLVPARRCVPCAPASSAFPPARCWSWTPRCRCLRAYRSAIRRQAPRRRNPRRRA